MQEAMSQSHRKQVAGQLSIFKKSSSFYFTKKCTPCKIRNANYYMCELSNQKNSEKNRELQHMIQEKLWWGLPDLTAKAIELYAELTDSV